MKTCNKCGSEKPLDGFHRNKNEADGRVRMCKECAKAKTKRWRDDNTERAREYDRERYPQVVKGRTEGNPLYTSLTSGKYRARRARVPADDITTEQVLADWERRGINPEACAYCGGEFEELEHMHPLSREGSPGHVLGNLAPSCARCNDRKHRQHWVEYLATRSCPRLHSTIRKN